MTINRSHNLGIISGQEKIDALVIVSFCILPEWKIPSQSTPFIELSELKGNISASPGNIIAVLNILIQIYFYTSTLYVDSLAFYQPSYVDKAFFYGIFGHFEFIYLFHPVFIIYPV